jgi:hypothetical protein
MAQQLRIPPTLCVNCGDEIVIVAKYLSNGGPLCADCAPNEGREPDTLGPPNWAERAEAAGDRAASSCTFKGCLRVNGHTSFHTTVPAVAKREDAREATKALAAGVAASIFRPESGAVGLAIEVEEWLYFDPGQLGAALYLLATPRDLYTHRLSEAAGCTRVSIFAVVLEWERPHGGPTLRDVGAAFSCNTSAGQSALERTSCLAEAMSFARVQAKRLKAIGPYGYRLAREVPHATAQEAPVATAEATPDGGPPALRTTPAPESGGEPDAA